ncbi:lipopolysaccharide biosynthesis protein [Microbacterium sp. ZXX196]|uniref:lipopolysaccharide biosynthesis protein n=1 Tax=Microbacterium sp. ZXX196 TaxID=2609291 RepID=UPI0012B8739B|nr:oligosaccharide flippase family protein [Microbacterium sp. ZXX196]MTE23274.1 oligosaccharide flippase family protein [Microbacterium sp. ZXX196]
MMAVSDRRFLGQFAWVSGGRIFAAGLQAISLILIARLVAPAEFGMLSSIIGLATVLQTTMDFGVSTYITRERAANPNSGGIATALRFNGITSLAMAAFVLVGLCGMGVLVSPTYYLMLPLALWISGERNADARLAVVFADGDAWINVVNLVSRRVVAIVIFVVLVLAGVDPILSYGIGVSIAAAASSIFANTYVSRRVSAESDITYRKLIADSHHYWANSVATQLRNLDVVIVAIFAGSVASGFYASASRLTSPLRILPTSLASVLIPAATRAVASRRSLWPLLKPAGVMLLAVTVIYMLLGMATPWLVPLALGDAYIPAIPVVQVVLVGLPFAASVSISNALLQAIGAKQFVAIAAGISTILCLIAVAFASIFYGALGAGWALTATFAFQAFVVIAKLAPYVRWRQQGGEAS